MNDFVSFVSGYLGINSVIEAVLMVVDIAIVAFLIYKIVVLLRDTRAFSILKGIIFVFIANYVAKLLRLNTLSAVLSIVLNVLPVVTVVLFAPEIRKIFEGIGKRKFSDIVKIFNGKSVDDDEETAEIKKIVDETIDAVQTMSKTKTGAIIAFELSDSIAGWDKQGTIIDAKVSSRLLQQIFVVNTPLHDAAVIIRDKRIYAAQCVLPLTENTSVSPELGTRHRAAIGASEAADCMVVVVSEETGIISLAQGGKLTRNISLDFLRVLLVEGLLPQTKSTEKKSKKSTGGKKNGEICRKPPKSFPF